MVNSKELETGLRATRAGIPYTLLLRIEAIRFGTFWASTLGLGIHKWNPWGADGGVGKKSHREE